MKRASTIVAFALAVLLTSFVLNSLQSLGVAQQPVVAPVPAPDPLRPGTYSVVVAQNLRNDLRLFFIDTQNGRLWWSRNYEAKWQEVACVQEPAQACYELTFSVIQTRRFRDLRTAARLFGTEGHPA